MVPKADPCILPSLPSSHQGLALELELDAAAGFQKWDNGPLNWALGTLVCQWFSPATSRGPRELWALTFRALCPGLSGCGHRQWQTEDMTADPRKMQDEETGPKESRGEAQHQAMWASGRVEGG